MGYRGHARDKFFDRFVKDFPDKGTNPRSGKRNRLSNARDKSARILKHGGKLAIYAGKTGDLSGQIGYS